MSKFRTVVMCGIPVLVLLVIFLAATLAEPSRATFQAQSAAAPAHTTAANCYAQIASAAPITYTMAQEAMDAASADYITYTIVQEAIDAAGAGDLVKVAGVCAGVQDRAGLVQTAYISKNITLRGGYTITNWTMPDPIAYPTTLDAQDMGRVLYIAGDITATIEGLRITAGNTTGQGGGVYVVTATATFNHNWIFDNTAEWGGGLFLENSASTLDGNSITNNLANRGGGLALEHSNATLRNNLVADNQVNSLGGGLYIVDSSPHMLHSTIASNVGGDGSGIHVTGIEQTGNVVDLTNTILVNHDVGVSVTDANTVTLEATLWGAATWANLTDWSGTGAILTGTHNIWGKPAFVNPNAGNYHLGATSEAIDQGINAGVTTDIDGDARPWGASHDLGADEFTGVPLSSVMISGPTVGIAGTTYAFDAIVSPPTATLPIVYTWSPAPLLGQGSDSVLYNWPTTGTQTISVTVSNASKGGIVTDTHDITLDAPPPDAVPVQSATINGPTMGDIDTDYIFTATIAPLSATLPIDYIWSPPPDSGQGSATARYNWPVAGPQTIVFVATNPGGTASDTHDLSIEKQKPDVPTLNPIDNPEGHSAYTISWSSADVVISYTLEQATDSDFTSASEVYDGPNTSCLISGQGMGRYFYRVKAYNAWGDRGWSNVQSVDVIWESEPNDSYSQSNGPLAFGLTYFGAFSSTADLDDYFHFDINASHNLVLSLTNILTSHNYDLTLLDNERNVVGSSSEAGNADEHIQLHDLLAGRYYVQVYNRSQTSSAQAYHLWVDGIRQWPVYLPLLEFDWPPLPDHPTLNAISNPNGIGTYLISWSEVDTAILYTLEEATNSTFIDATEIYAGTSVSYTVSERGAARYYYRVRARNEWGDGEWSDDTWVDVLWEHQDNDSFDDADGPLQLNLSYKGYPEDDEDFFKFVTESTGQITIDLTNHTGKNVWLMLYNGLEIEMARTYTNQLKYTGSAGLYYIRIYTASDFNDTTPYTLRVTFP